MTENKKQTEAEDAELEPAENIKSKTSLMRFLVGSIIAPLPVAAFWACGIVGAVSGIVAGLGLFALSLCFGWRHVEYTICVVIFSFIGFAFGLVASWVASPVMGMLFFESIPFTGGILGVLLGMGVSVFLKPWPHEP